MEFVYVVKRFDLFEMAFPHGFRRPWEVPLDDYLGRIRSRGFFVERRHAETDSTMKQIIPYCVILREGPAAAAPEIFTMRRKETGGESRLFNLHSIGVGGHINPVDGDADPLLVGLTREIEEEVIIDEPMRPEPLGVINDETQAVGSVHFGLVYGLRVEGDVRVRETEQLEGHWTPTATLTEMLSTDRDAFESWSALILDRVDDIS